MQLGTGKMGSYAVQIYIIGKFLMLCSTDNFFIFKYFTYGCHTRQDNLSNIRKFKDRTYILLGLINSGGCGLHNLSIDFL